MNRKKTIFVIDDESVNLKYFKRILSKDYNVVTSENSESCFPIIRASMPDIILLDIYMPVISGYDLCKTIVADEKTKSIPIIFVSSMRDSEHIEKGLSLGAVDFLQKPINKIETLARIKTHLEISQLQNDLAVSNSKLKLLLEEKTEELESEHTHKNRLQKELFQSESKFRTIFTSAPEAIIIVSVESGEIVDVNPAGCKLFGYSYDELIGLNQTELLKPSNEKIKLNILNSRENGNSEPGNRILLNTLVKKNGEELPVNNSSRTILHEGELFILGVIFDLSAQIKIEEELRRSKEHADELNRLKGFFLSNMSHELRTPLVGMLGFSNILEEELEDSNLKHMAKAITISGKRLLNTLKVLMDYSILESNDFNTEWDEININEIIREVVSSYKASYEERGLKLELHIPKKDIKIKADESFITEVVSQLVNNAITYTHYGSISVFLKTEKRDDKKYLLLTIKDTGIGISQEKLKSIFDDFRQISEGCTREYEGLGLGLALVKKIVDLHNGEITVKSKENEGSLFQLKIACH